MFVLDRTRKSGAFLEWKVRIFTVAAVLAVVGMYLEERWMTGLAIVVLLVGVGLRLALDRKPMMPDEEEDDADRSDDGEDDDDPRTAAAHTE